MGSNAQRRRPADHKAEGPVSQEPFVYKTESGEVITIPPGDTVPIGVVRKMRNQPEVSQLFSLLEYLLPDDEDGNNPAMDTIDAMTGAEFTKFQKAWKKHSERSQQATLGES